MARRNDPALKAEICERMLERFKGDVAVNDVNELLNLLSVNAPLGKQKRALGSLLYSTKHVSRYHDEHGQRHFKVLKPFVA